MRYKQKSNAAHPLLPLSYQFLIGHAGNSGFTSVCRQKKGQCQIIVRHLGTTECAKIMQTYFNTQTVLLADFNKRNEQRPAYLYRRGNKKEFSLTPTKRQHIKKPLHTFQATNCSLETLRHRIHPVVLLVIL